MKIALILLLASFLVALPGLVIACELRCASVPSVSRSQPAPASHCGGHSEGKTSESPASAPAPDRHGCGGHALLARGTAPVSESGSPHAVLAPTAPIPASPELRAALTRLPEPASSPPPARRSSVLRL